MRAAGALAGLSAPRDLDPIRDALLSRMEPVAVAWAAQDAEFDAESAALEAAGAVIVPGEEELAGLVPDPLSDPPDGAHGWLADLPGPLLDQYLAATAETIGPETPRTGFRDHVSGEGVRFPAAGPADLGRPGPVLAGFAARAYAAGLSRLTDDELAGVIRAGRRLSSWASAVELAAVGDLMRRREAQEAAGHPRAAEHADAEIAALLTLTGRGAGRVLDLAMSLRRLPLTAQALAAGAIDLPRAAVIADETAGLDDDHTAAVERHVLVRAPGQTTSQLRAAARRAVLSADPRAARKRQEQAQREARVEHWDEHAGTAALAGRDLPPAEVIAADQHISALARALRAAGLAGTADQLRARAFLALLCGTPASSLVPADPPPAVGHTGNPAGAPMPRNTARPCDPSTSRSPSTPRDPSTLGGRAAPGGPGMAGDQAGPAAAALPADSAGLVPPAPSDWPGIAPVAGMVNLTMPWGTWFGSQGSPGEVAGFGPLSAADSRHLGVAMAGHPLTRWCVTLTGADGRPVAHGCARSAPPAPRPAPPGAGPTRRPAGPAPPGAGPAPPGAGSAPPGAGPTPRPAGPAPPGAGPTPPAPGSTTPASVDRSRAAGWLAGMAMTWFESDGCTHPRQSAAYRPPPALRHLIGVRQRTCAFPGCRRPASQCDLDHTTPFHRGGPTCECNMAPLCRKHHEAKQAPGWHLEQPRPGVLAWTTPSGYTVGTEPTVYPD